MSNNQFFGVGNTAIYNPDDAAGAVYVMSDIVSLELTDAPEQQMQKNAAGSTIGVFTGSRECTGTLTINGSAIEMMTAICGYVLRDTTATVDKVGVNVSHSENYKGATITLANNATIEVGSYVVRGAIASPRWYKIAQDGGLVRQTKEPIAAPSDVTIAAGDGLTPAAGDYLVVTILPAAIPERGTYEINANVPRPEIALVAQSDTRQKKGETLQICVPRCVVGETGISFGRDAIGEMAIPFTALADNDGRLAVVQRVRKA